MIDREQNDAENLELSVAVFGSSESERALPWPPRQNNLPSQHGESQGFEYRVWTWISFSHHRPRGVTIEPEQTAAKRKAEDAIGCPERPCQPNAVIHAERLCFDEQARRRQRSSARIWPETSSRRKAP